MDTKSKLKNISDKISKDNKNRWILTIPWIIGCIVFMLIVMKKGYVSYELNDDINMSFAANGIYGKYYPLNMFNNFLLSTLFSGLFSISSAHNWTFLYYFVFIFISYIIFGVWNIYINRLIPAYFTSILLVVATYNALFRRMNFTKSASIILAVGYILLFTTLDNKKMTSKLNILVKAISFILIAAGCLIRWDSFLSSIPFLVVMGGYIFIKNSRKIKSISTIIGVLIAGLIVWSANYLVYQNVEDWKYWSDYNLERASLLDYAMTDYDANEERFAQIGISKNDYEALNNWIYADDTVYDIDTLKKIEEIRDDAIYHNSKWSKQNIENGILNCLSLFNSNSIIYVVLFLFLMTVPTLKKNEIIMLVGSFIFCFGEIFYLIINERCPERAFFTPIMILFSIIIYFIKEISKSRLWINSFLITCILIYNFYGSNFYTIDRIAGFHSINREETISMMSELASESENLYVWDTLEYDLFRFVYSPFDVPEFGLAKNSVTLGGWMVPSPIMSERTESFGEKYNYLKLLAENPNVYFITVEGDSLDIIEQYIREHYNPNVSRLLVREINGYYVYSFVLGNN